MSAHARTCLKGAWLVLKLCQLLGCPRMGSIPTQSAHAQFFGLCGQTLGLQLSENMYWAAGVSPCTGSAFLVIPRHSRTWPRRHESGRPGDVAVWHSGSFKRVTAALAASKVDSGSNVTTHPHRQGGQTGHFSALRRTSFLTLASQCC